MVGPVSGHRGLKRIAAAFGLVGTAASIWWFALRPRRRARQGSGSAGQR